MGKRKGLKSQHSQDQHLKKVKNYFLRHTSFIDPSDQVSDFEKYRGIAQIFGF